MIEEYRRCENCRIVYTFQVTGWGSNRYNGPCYCPDCKHVIDAALAKVMKQREQVAILCNDFTKEQVIAIIAEDETALQERLAVKRAAGIRCVFPPEYDSTDEGGMNTVGTFTRNNITYKYSWWEKRDDDKYPFRLIKCMEKDLTTGEIIGPWRDYRSN